jgi:hypothetical protein
MPVMVDPVRDRVVVKKPRRPGRGKILDEDGPTLTRRDEPTSAARVNATAARKEKGPGWAPRAFKFLVSARQSDVPSSLYLATIRCRKATAASERQSRRRRFPPPLSFGD